MINYNNKRFKPVNVSENGQVSASVEFLYQQEGNILHCTYQGGTVRLGQLIGTVDATGCIDMRYQQVTQDGELCTGVCRSQPEFLENGRLRLHEKWRWTSGDLSEGTSILEEL